MALFNKPWMLWCMLLFIATVTSGEQRTALDQILSGTFQQIINALQIIGQWVFDDKNDILSFGRYQYPQPGEKSGYDYVIIGAGSAGCALASRLTEDPNMQVLLIEAGKPESILTDIPLIAPLFQRTDYVTQYVTEKQRTSCRGMQDQRCVWPRGRAVGGSSVINYMIYTRGRRLDWDRMNERGCTGWSYDNVVHYYKKSEQCHLKDYSHMAHRGREGKVHVEDVKFRTPLAHAFLEAARLYRYDVGDYNSKEGYGFGYLQATLNNGFRHSAAKAYLYPHRDRPNLHILHSTTATKILIDDKNKAYGVEYNHYGNVKYASANKEVIVSAGPIASPQLLMLSGIGPTKHLESLGIRVFKDLPVGQTLYDHLFFPGQIYLLNTSSVTLHESDAATFDEINRWFNNEASLMGSPGGVEAIGYIKTSASTDPDQVPDVELMDCGGSLLSDSTYGGSQAVRRGARITDETFLSALNLVKNNDTWSAMPVLLHPKSKGYLELRDNNPFSHPKIYTNYLTDRKDVAAMIAAIRTIQKFTKTRAFQQYEPRLLQANYHHCKGIQFDSDAYWECALRTLASSLHHQTGTCKMGPSWDRDAVVDPELRVYGIDRLRVADTSIIPQTTSAHTNAPGMMIGEKAADLIKNARYNNKNG